MAKISPVSIKYMIYANFKAEGPVEKPDVIGAIFGQTEGLLGAEMEMRELQKEGKIGRIEVDLETVDGKSIGQIKLPSALDKSETTILAATLETIDRIGPTEAKVEVAKIEDVRGNKRDYIIERARKLLEGIDSSGELGEMTKALKTESRVSKIQEYGEEKIPAGDLSGPELIIVEGRADVVNLLKNRINNVIGMNGVKLPREIAELSKEKEVTLFVDGDRGGVLIAKNVISNAKIDFVAVAPDGKEVEELTGKEILQSLRRKVPVSEYIRKSNWQPQQSASIDLKEAKEKVKESYKAIKGTGKAVLMDENFEMIKEISSKEAAIAIKKSRKPAAAVIIDGAATGIVIKACDEKGVSFLGATNFSSVPGSRVQLISLY